MPDVKIVLPAIKAVFVKAVQEIAPFLSTLTSQKAEYHNKAVSAN
jgi:hypothetical protein